MGHGDVIEVQSLLPLLVVLVPLIGFFLIQFSCYKRPRLAYGLAILTNLGALAGLLGMISRVWAGQRLVYLLTGLFYPFQFKFEVGPLGLFMALLSGTLWLVATIYSRAYLKGRENQKRYYAYLELTLVGALGVYLTGELFSLFLFFEILSLASFVLVIQNETEEAIEAGYLYLFMGIFGGLCLLLGLTILATFGGTLDLAELAGHLPSNYSIQYVAAVLLIVGFGIKAGMVPVHIWLPQAHPVAPTPASALLSGVMIKAGAYGIFLTISAIFADGVVGENLSLIMIWIGMITMLLGGFSAIRQQDAKRLLAYSSVSQVGYIILAIGLNTYLGEHYGPLGFIGGFFHVLNHAIFKVGFFLNFGIIYTLTHKRRLDKLGGLLRDLPIVAIFFVVLAGGIIGVPGFNGYASKVLIHHALSKAVIVSHHALSFRVLEMLFVLAGSLTFAYMVKLFVGLFFGEKPADLKFYEPTSKLMRLVVLPLVGLVLLIGIKPEWVLNKVILQLGVDQHFVEEFFGQGHFSFWNQQDLIAVLPYFVIGMVLYLMESRYFIFTRIVPEWFGIHQLVHGVVRILGVSFKRVYNLVSDIASQTKGMILEFGKNHVDKLIHFDRKPQETRIGPVSIASLDFSKFWVAIVIVVFLMLSILKLINLS